MAFQRFLRGRRDGRTRRQPSPSSSSSGVDVAPENRPAATLPSLKIFQAPTENSTRDEDAKVKVLEQKFRMMGTHLPDEKLIRFALRSNYSKGIVDKALEFVLILTDSLLGVVHTYKPNIKLLGAENRANVTCYIDSLLFAMFARLDCFEGILCKTFDDEPRTHLVNMLRLWVNMLRSGKLITKDITARLQNLIADCGWREAAWLRQQDASELFTFITGKLELPLLTMKVDLFHTGKEEANDDHKFVNERLLEIPIPPDPEDGSPITLEDCLELYFNNRVEVKRFLERQNTISSTSKQRQQQQQQPEKKGEADVEVVELSHSSSPTLPPDETNNPPADTTEASTPHSSRDESKSLSGPCKTTNSRPNSHSPSSTDQHPSADQHGNAATHSNANSELTKNASKKRRHTLRNEVMMPALQVFSLLPWYTDNVPAHGAQNAIHFSQRRPILGMCLKRYTFLNNGRAARRDVYVDIPIEIGLPNFIKDDELDDDSPIFGNFKLVLQSVVCHRGSSIDSGHYVSLVRGTSARNPESRSNSPHDYKPEAKSGANGAGAGARIDSESISESVLGSGSCSVSGSGGSASVNGTGQGQGQRPDASAGAGTHDIPQLTWMRFDDLAPERITLIDIQKALKEETPYLLFYQILPIDAPPEHDFEPRPPSYDDIDSDIYPDPISEKMRMITEANSPFMTLTNNDGSPQLPEVPTHISFSDSASRDEQSPKGTRYPPSEGSKQTKKDDNSTPSNAAGNERALSKSQRNSRSFFDLSRFRRSKDGDALEPPVPISNRSPVISGKSGGGASGGEFESDDDQIMIRKTRSSVHMDEYREGGGDHGRNAKRPSIDRSANAAPSQRTLTKMSFLDIGRFRKSLNSDSEDKEEKKRTTGPTETTAGSKTVVPGIPESSASSIDHRKWGTPGDTPVPLVEAPGSGSTSGSRNSSRVLLDLGNMLRSSPEKTKEKGKDRDKEEKKEKDDARPRRTPPLSSQSPFPLPTASRPGSSEEASRISATTRRPPFSRYTAMSSTSAPSTSATTTGIGTPQVPSRRQSQFVEGGDSENGPARSSAKRGRSLHRRMKTKGKGKGRKPERECVVM